MVHEVVIEPEWSNLIRWHGNALATHSFDYGAKAPIRAFIDMVRYLALTDPNELNRIMEEFNDPHSEVTVEEDEDEG